ncbi:hypothetical protein [Nostoc sp. C117]|uniref:hypothetical protein n=1 Tax=Nostoc sp. C117 TaxID=3349875 RepID=UPI00370D8807
MRLTTLIDSVFIVACIAFSSGIVSAQPADNSNYISPNVEYGATNHKQTNIAITTNTLNQSGTINSYVEPFNLVAFAYQGGLNQQGIPSGETLLVQTQSQKILALDLVKAAVNANRLSAQVLNDQDYLSAVKLQLDALPDYAAAD